MLAELGIITSALALVVAWYAVVAGVVGALNRNDRWVRSARNAALLTFPLLTAASLAMIISQVNGDFQIEYVWATTERASGNRLDSATPAEEPNQIMEPP